MWRRLGVLTTGAWLASTAIARHVDAQRGPAPGVQPDSQHVAIGRILGVLDGQSSLPVDSAEVTDLIAGVGYRTGKAGLIGLAGFRRQHDTIAVRVRKLGFQDTAFVVLAGAADSVPITLVLNRAQMLPAVLSTAVVRDRIIGPLQEFSERLNDKSLHAAFFTPEMMRKNDGRRVNSLIFPALIGECGRSDANPRYFVNGLLTFKFSELPHDVDDYDAAEVYSPASTPLQYRLGGGGCTVLLWMREK